MNLLRLAWRHFRREWRAGELMVLGAAVAVAVAAATAVGGFVDRVDTLMTRRAGQVIGADLAVSARERLPDSLVESANGAGLDTAHVTMLASVITTGDGGRLAEIRAVSDKYPLRGQVELADRPFGEGRPVDGLPDPGTAWIDSRVLAALDLSVGDTVGVGRSRITVGGILAGLPDQGVDFVDVAPTVLIRRDDLGATGLVREGSRVRYRLLVAGPAETVAQWREKAKPLVPDHARVRTVEDSRREIADALDRARSYLGLAALVSVLLAAVAVAMAAREYARRRMDASAVMKVLGASQRRLGGLHALQLLFTGLAAVVVGAGLGFGAERVLTGLLADMVNEPLPAPGFVPALAAGVMGLTVLAGFGLPPVLALRRTPPARVLRSELPRPTAGRVLTYLAATGAVAALLYFQAGDARLAGLVGGGMLVIAGALALGALGLVALISRLRGGAGAAWRYGLAGISRRRGDSIAQTMAFGLGLTALLLLAVVRTDLLSQWRADLPEDAPNHFLVNIQPDELSVARAHLEQAGLTVPDFRGIVRARLIGINGTSIEELAEKYGNERDFLRRQANLSWAETPNEGNLVVAGDWWKETDRGRPLASLGAEFARRMGVNIGDRLTFDIAGTETTLTIDNLRRIRWDTFKPNFFILTPPETLGDHPATYIASLHVPGGREDVLVDLVRKLPSVTVIDVGAILEQVRSIMDQAARAVEFVFGFTLAAGVVVLLAAVQASRRTRQFESALLRALGASRRVVLTGVITEFAVIGLLAGILAASGATVTGWLLATRVFEITYQPPVLLWLAGPGGGAVLVALTGWLATRRVVGHPPLAVLRRG